MKQAILSITMALWTLTGSAQGAISAAGESADRYALVSDASTLRTGDRLLIVCYSDDSSDIRQQVLSTTQNTDNRSSVRFSPNDDKTITPTEKMAIIELGGSTGKWTLRVTNGDATGYLCAASSSKNSLHTKQQADENALASIAIADGTATIRFLGSYANDIILYNTDGLFSCYNSSTSKTRYPKLYRLIASSDVHGDINRDGALTIADVTALVNILLGKEGDYDRAAADVNQDGAKTIADVTALVNLLLGK